MTVQNKTAVPLEVDGRAEAAPLMDSVELKYEAEGSQRANALGLGYVALMSREPQPLAIQQLSQVCAEKWSTFPVSYVSARKVLTLAIHDYAQQEKLKRRIEFLVPGCHVRFVGASQSEIHESIAVHYAGRVITEPRITNPKRRSLQIQAPPQASSAADSTHSALTGMAAMFVRLLLENDAALFQRTRLHARYVRYLCAAVRLPYNEADMAVLAAWLSPFQSRPELVAELLTPYPLYETCFTTAGKDHGAGVEAGCRIVSLVSAFLDQFGAQLHECPDTASVRMHLEEVWRPCHSAERMLLKQFLDLLNAEEKIRKDNPQSGMILLTIDPRMPHEYAAYMRLPAAGFMAEFVPDAASAFAFMSVQRPDLLILSAALTDCDAVSLCRRLKRTPHATPVLMLLPPKTLTETICLKAGADDTLIEPLNFDTLLLKLKRFVALPVVPAPQENVSGSLSHMPFPDMIQVLCASGKSIRIELRNDNLAGQVYVRDGEIIHAESGEYSGADAFYRMIAWTKGSFTAHDCDVFPATTIHASVMSLLMEGSRLADEQQGA